MAAKCDLCGGALIMGAGGQSATCKTCGMEYSVERVRELMALDTVAAAPQADRQEQATTCVLFDDYHAVLLELFEEHTGISAADMSLDEEELEHAVFDMIPLASKVSTIDFGDYAIIATTKGVMTKVLDAAMRKTLSRYKKGQRGAKLWCRIFLSTHYRDEFIQFVLPDNVLWEVSGLSEGTLEQAVAELQQELPFGIALKGRNDIVQNTAPTPALQEDVLEATWEETSDADVAALPTEIFHMMVDEAHYILGQGAVAQGFVKAGAVHEGDSVTIIKKETKECIKAAVRSIGIWDEHEEKLKPVDSAKSGDTASLFLAATSRKDVACGDVLTR